MPWRGPDPEGDQWPTLGHQVAAWIEAHVVIPDRERLGELMALTDEQYMHLLHVYRLVPQARDGDGSDAFQYSGDLLVRPQKWGKDPFAAAIICAEALGPVRFAGWDSDGEPVGSPWPTPHIQCAGNAEEQTGNTFRPLLTMLREGPLAVTAGLDAGETRVNLPGGGRIEPVTASSRARQGQRVTFVSITESQLMTETSGGLKLARTLKRNLGGMDGRWMEISNAWDPSERSVAQRTFEARDPYTFLDYREPLGRVDLTDDADVMAKLAHQYGDSAVDRGGWVNLNRIRREAQNPAHSEGEVRRYYFNEITVGSTDAVNPELWKTQARTDEILMPGDRITLGFHGALNRQSTSLCAARLSDGRLFHLHTWARGENDGAGWQVPRPAVHAAVDGAFTAYDVVAMMASCHGWQTEVNEWAGRYDAEGKAKVLEFWLNSEQRMDQLVERFTTAHRGDDITHDGSEELLRHALASSLASGKMRPSAEEREPGQPEHYLRVVQKSSAVPNSAFLAALLAYEARGWAIEHGELVEQFTVSIW